MATGGERAPARGDTARVASIAAPCAAAFVPAAPARCNAGAATRHAGSRRSLRRASHRPCAPARRRCAPARLRAEFKGFGSRPPSQQPPSERPDDAKSPRQREREEAAARHDDMKASGAPEYSVFLRVRNPRVNHDLDVTGWIPVGSVTVPRSDDVERAILVNERNLREAAFRLYPRLRKEKRAGSPFEYGFVLTEYMQDEKIRPARCPPDLAGQDDGADASEGSAEGGILGGWLGALRRALKPRSQQ